MISLDNNAGSKEFALLSPLSSLRDSNNRPLVEVFNFSDGNIPGDAFFAGNGPSGLIQIGIEIKSLHDLCSSLDTGRLQGQGTNSSHGQILRMLEYFDVTVLIYYGNYWCAEDLFIKYSTSSGDELLDRIASRFRSRTAEHASSPYRFVRWLSTLSKTLCLGPRRHFWHGLHNALMELQLVTIEGKSPSIYRVNNKHEVAVLISSLYHFFQKSWNNHKLLRVFNTSNPSSRLLSNTTHTGKTPHHIIVCAKLISTIEGIGYERGLAIAYHFNGNIPLMITAISSNPRAIEHITVNGRKIGPVVSESVHHIIASGEIDTDALTKMLK